MRGRCRRAHVDASGFKESRLIAGFDRKTAAALLGVTTRTVRNWESRRVGVPYSAFKLMRILSGYALPGEAWRGWCVRGNTLWSPSGQAFEAGSLGYLSLVFRMARQFRLEHAAHSTWRSGRARELVCARCGVRRRARGERSEPRAAPSLDLR
jgi:transcriptional regulator with XRE-family HTH domain